METPPLNERDIELGDPPIPRGRVDFGVTNSHGLWRAYTGDGYADGPQRHLRLIAYIEDLHLFQVAAKRDLGLSALEDVVSKRLPITLALDGSPFIAPIIEYYGLEALESWGGVIKHGFGGENTSNRADFDVLITAHGGLAGNIENDQPACFLGPLAASSHCRPAPRHRIRWGWRATARRPLGHCSAGREPQSPRRPERDS
jgi:hypothetical protein